MLDPLENPLHKTLNCFVGRMATNNLITPKFLALPTDFGISQKSPNLVQIIKLIVCDGL